MVPGCVAYTVKSGIDKFLTLFFKALCHFIGIEHIYCSIICAVNHPYGHCDLSCIPGHTCTTAGSNCSEKLGKLIPLMAAFKQRLQQAGYSLYESEILKLTIDAKVYGYTGNELADLLRDQNIEPEFADPDFLVLMFSLDTDEKMLTHLEQILLHIPARAPIQDKCPRLVKGERVLSIREAMLSISQTLPIHRCIGRILAVPTVGCPPAVPILVCGERIDAHAVKCFSYYGIDSCCVVV